MAEQFLSSSRLEALLELKPSPPPRLKFKESMEPRLPPRLKFKESMEPRLKSISEIFEKELESISEIFEKEKKKEIFEKESMERFFKKKEEEFKSPEEEYPRPPSPEPEPEPEREREIKLYEEKNAKWESYLKSAERTKSELLEALSSDLPDHRRRQLQEELESVKKEITDSISMIQYYERELQNYERKLAERRGADVERQRKEDSKRLFEEAMKDGYVKLNIINMLLSGVAGSGKTSLKYLLTDKPPPEQRSSTPCMEKPLRVDVRSVTSSKFKTTGRGWVEISQDKLLDLLSRIVAQYQKKSSVQSVQSVQGEKVTEALQEKALRSKVTSPSEKYVPIMESSESHEAINDTIDTLITKIVRKLSKKRPKSSVLELGGEMFDSAWVYISDCGGQPQFHEISPLFIQHVSVAAVVFRLTDDFSSFPLDEYYKDGKRVGLPRASHMTLEETLKSLIQSIESHCSQEKKPSLMFVGTFLDKLLSMPSLEEKNRTILDILPADMKNQVVYSEGWQRPIFALNAVSREDSVLACAENIRKAIEACAPLEIKVPIWWSLLDINLQNLSFKLGRGVLSKQECLVLATRLGFQEEHLDAALRFFDEVCIAHYYPSILPDTIFINAQIPLDKISELTEYAITLRNPDLKSVMDGKMKRLAEGIIALEFLTLDRFEKHYVDGVFSPADMLLIMKKLLVIAPIPVVGEAECSLSKAEFFMPSLLESVPPADLEKHRKSTISPIALYFPSGCIRSGVFCCLVVYVMKVLKWSLLLPSGERLFISKNCIKFSIPNRTCFVTLIDSFSYIEIYVEAPPTICNKLCPDIHEQVVKGIRASCEVLHYNNDSPNVGIFCPCRKSGMKKHLATVNLSEGFWSCSLQSGVWGALKYRHKVWNGTPYVPPPTVNDHPRSVSIKEGENVCLEVQAEGTHLNYLWHKSDVPLRDGQGHYRGVTTPTLSISRASSQLLEGEYHCVVSNEEGQVTSSPQTLFVVEHPCLISDQPSSKKVTDSGGSVTSSPSVEQKSRARVCVLLIFLLLPIGVAVIALWILGMTATSVCDKLTSPENGQVVYIPGGHSLTHGALAVYLCDEGFTLNGNPIRVCVASDSKAQGTWTSQPPLCLRGTTGGGSQSTHAVDSVQELVKMLSDIGNWEALCTNLGVRQAVMSELIHSPLDVSIKKKRCLESYFISGHAHWEEVITAVVGPSIFNERVAKKIAHKYLLDYKAILKNDEL